MPRLAFNHIDEVPSVEVMPQMHGDRKAAIHLKILERTAERLVSYTRYDPGYVVARHSHGGDEVIYIIEGDVMMGDVRCRPGTSIVLEKGASIEPIVAGHQGTVLLEIFLGAEAGNPIYLDDEESRRLFQSRGIDPLLDDAAPSTAI